MKSLVSIGSALTLACSATPPTQRGSAAPSQSSQEPPTAATASAVPAPALAGPDAPSPDTPTRPALGDPLVVELKDPFDHVYRVELRPPQSWQPYDPDEPSTCRESYWPNTWLPTNAQLDATDCTAVTLMQTAYGGDGGRRHNPADMDAFVAERARDTELTISSDERVGANRLVVSRGNFRGKRPAFRALCLLYDDAATALVYLDMRGPPEAEAPVLDDLRASCSSLKWLTQVQ